MTIDGSRAARDEAMERVEAHAHELWKEKAQDCLDWLIRERERWTSDDFWEAMAEHYPTVTTHEPRALGPLLARLTRDGRIEQVGTQASRRVVHHAHPLKVYGKPNREARVAELANLLLQATGFESSLQTAAEWLDDHGVRVHGGR